MSAEKFEFKTEVNQLLELVIHSLYSHREIFLRELISNASDALDKLRFESLKNKDLLGTDTDLRIKLFRDDKAGTLTITDNGIGMTREALINNLGTIAHSGTKDFVEKLKKAKDGPELIGQFGVGFYSAFMAADKVTVNSKTADGTACSWISAGQGNFELGESAKTTRGTEIILQLKKESREYLDEYTLRDLIKKYSDYVEYPIYMDIEREEVSKDADGKPIEKAKPEKKIIEEKLNSQKALWTRNKSEISAEEYNDFYKHIAHSYDKPLEIIHYSAEGVSEFRALLYIPEQAPFDLFTKESSLGLNLYIKRVFIMHDCKKLIPEYLRFLKGVADSNDLPLNVSREILQEDTQLEKIKKNITKKVLSTLKTLKEKDFEKYLKFYKEFGAVLKEGLHYDYENKEAIAELLLFPTSNTDKYRSLDNYVTDMPKDQKDIYYLSAETRGQALASPHLGALKAKNYEVLFLHDVIDEFVIPQLFEYKGKKLLPINSADLDLGDKKDTEHKTKEAAEKFGSLLNSLKTALSAQVQDVRFSARLTDSVCGLSADTGAISPQMQKMFKAMGQTVPEQKKILELNPGHPLIAKLSALTPERLSAYGSLLYNQAVLADGGKLDDPLEFIKQLNDLLLKATEA
ncbi:molecular chaperone HtpG [Candidatus Termititenax dinenymphae]|uniref:Chaperone protein HtpG n=1 Tax=Candidatus Termititenax dinenymphae TaxID=2218523 RepID=A0A388TKA5_9BACT|nr:molecular chaperone HtpG [Candidatus Termititenax dinenymphae]